MNHALRRLEKKLSELENENPPIKYHLNWYTDPHYNERGNIKLKFYDMFDK